MSEIIYKELLAELLSRRNLSAGQMEAAILAILQGVWTPAQTAGFLIAIKIKGETPEELAAAATAMRQMMTPASINDEQLVDTCGTGGDGAKLFNISTAAAFVAAAAGVRIAKHGNRAVSGSSGSSDVLAELGMPLDLSPDKIAECIRQTGIGFMFAPNHHPAMRHAAPVRKELGVRTMFNLLGPMTNPAGARRQVVGVYDPQLLTPYAETLTAIGTIRALVVHGNGIDELTINGETDIAEVKNGAVHRMTISPEDVGLTSSSLDSLHAESATESANIIHQVFDGAKIPARDIVLLNAAAALLVADMADDFTDGVTKAAAAIDSGGAKQKLQQCIDVAKS